MKFVVDEINPVKCPFFIDEDWVDKEYGEAEIVSHVHFEESCCKLDSFNLCKEDIYFGRCNAEVGDKECPFCITYDEFKRRMEKIKEEK